MRVGSCADIRLGRLEGGDNVRVTRVSDRQCRDGEELAAGRAEGVVRAGVVVDRDLREHGVVLDLGLLQGGAVVGEDDDERGALAKSLEGGLVAKGVLAGLGDEGELRVDRIGVLLGGNLAVKKLDAGKEVGVCEYTVLLRDQAAGETARAQDRQNYEKRQKRTFLLDMVSWSLQDNSLLGSNRPSILHSVVSKMRARKFRQIEKCI
jgi:hypothetical protein